MNNLEFFEREGAELDCCALPCTLDLVRVLSLSLRELTRAPLLDAGWPVDGPACLDEEMHARIASPMEGLLVLRSSSRLAAALCLDLKRGKTCCAEFVDGLMRRLSAGCAATGGRIWVYETLPGTSAHWPRRRPDQARAFMVGPEPVELRFWYERVGARS